MISRLSIPELLKVVLNMRLLVSDQNSKGRKNENFETRTEDLGNGQHCRKPSAKTRHNRASLISLKAKKAKPKYAEVV